MDNLTRISHGDTGYSVTTGRGVVLAEGATLDAALTALWHRGFTPQVAAASVRVAAVDGHVNVRAHAAA